MTPIKLQILKFKAKTTFQAGYNVLRRLYIHDNLLSESSCPYMLACLKYVIFSVETAQELFGLN
jgi:hypothetical protein